MIFATLNGLTIPEGVVTQIADAAGNVLWSAVKMAKLTISTVWDGMNGDSASITVTSPSPFAPDPSNPSNKVTSWTVSVADEPNRTIEIPVDSTIACTVSRDKGNADSHISLNGTKVVIGEGNYVYTVTGDVTIEIAELYVQGDYGVITIEGAVTHISFTINGETYQAIEGMSWTAWFASSYNTTGETEGTVTAGGNEVSLDAVIVDGTAYEVGFAKGFVPLYDFGTIQTPTSASIGGYNVTQYKVDLSFGFDEPTHMMVNGEIFEVVYSGGSNRHDYNIAGMTSIFVSAEYPYKIFFPQNANGTDYNATFTAFAAGTYTVSLGKYA